MGIKVSTGLDQHSSFQKGYHDAQVDINDEESLRKWGEVLHLTKDELVDAIRQFGPMIKNIRLGLKSNEGSDAA